MKITLNIETQDPADLERIAAALSGKTVEVNVQKAAQPGKSEKTTAAPAAAATAAAPSETASAAQVTTATAATSTPQQEVSVDEIKAAANVAVPKLGNGGVDKIRKYIAENCHKDDGTPATLTTVKADERPALLLKLQQIGRGEVTL